MKIVHINTVWNRCSTGRIAASLHALSETAGHSSLAAYGRGPKPDKLGIPGIRIGNPADFLFHVLRNFTSGRCGFSSTIPTRRFLRWLDVERPDLLHLHNLHGFYLHVGLLFDYIRAHDIPVVWTLHDCWPFTGHCAFFDESCKKWETGCHDCPVHRSAYPYALFRDGSKENWLAKRMAFTGVKRMRIVTPSKWLAELVRRSFLRDYSVEVLPNGIDISMFHPIEHANAKKEETAARKNVLAVANVWEPRKGLPILLDAAEALRGEFRFTLVGLSPAQRRAVQRRNPDIQALGRLDNQEDLVDLYNSARIFANPTLQDNFPTTNLEALACGTPVVTCHSGGSAECLSEACGITVEPENTMAFIEAIRTLDARISAGSVSPMSCRAQAMQYDAKACFQRYLDLYDRLAKEKRP